jgi:hypothetical protein
VPAPTWPAPGQKVVLLTGEQEQVCVVDDVRPPRCLVLREPVPVDGRTPVGSTLVLRWTTAAGRHELTARLARQVWDHMPLWEVHVLEDPSVFQQRSFARAADALSVELVHEDQRWHGMAVDISEGGARCSFEHATGLLAVGAVDLHMCLEDRRLVLRAQVLSVERGPEGRWTARLRFTAAGTTGDMLRRRVMEQQRRARAATRA